MATILTSSQQTFVDITDQRKLSAYITSNLPKTQSGASINLVPVKQRKYLKKELKNIRKNTSLKHENRGVKHVRK